MLLEKLKYVKEEYKCPITYEIMENPVIDSKGNTYDFFAINNYFLILKN